MSDDRFSFVLYSNGLNWIPSSNRSRRPALCVSLSQLKKRIGVTATFILIHRYSLLFLHSMECKQQAITAVAAVRQTALAGLLFFIVMTLLIGKCVLARCPARSAACLCVRLSAYTAILLISFLWKWSRKMRKGEEPWGKIYTAGCVVLSPSPSLSLSWLMFIKTKWHLSSLFSN